MKKTTSVCLVSSIAVAGLLIGCATHSTSKSSCVEAPATSLAPLPETITSFGAVTSDGWLYVFGGHKGERHEYSIEKVSGSFQRLKLSEGRTWESLPASTPGQGQPLVAHNGSIYRIGGMAARNKADAKQDLYSISLVQRFDPKRGSWEEFTPLPAIRSSHDAVVVGDKLYVAGGWQLAGGGSDKPTWPANALVFDFAHPQKGWQEFPQPFQRRALALAALGSRVYCIGGMDSDNKPTLAVEVYDTTNGQWTKGPDLPSGQFKGFACSAIAQDGRIYVTAFQGDLLRLAADERSWEVVGRLEHPRMAHRLVTAGKTQLIALGGEDGEEKRTDLELLTPSAKPQIAKQPVATALQAAAPHGHE
jgi:N-acetylneuraminic acid mutarotase